MTSNLPEGVSGFDPRIAGPTADYNDRRDIVCEHCESLTEEHQVQVLEWIDGATIYYECPKCGHEGEKEEP